MKTIKILTILFFLFGGIQTISAQEAARKSKDNKRDYTFFLKRTLQLDSAKAEQVALIQQNYKESVVKVVADSSLGDAGRKAKIQQLIDDKNRRLKLLLNPSQQSKLIPTTELSSIEVKQKP